MSGLEVAGLALAALPVVISAFEYFRNADDELKDLSKHDDAFEPLSVQFMTQQKRFELILQRLLGRIIPEDQKTGLLANQDGTFCLSSCLKDPRFNALLYNGLGERTGIFMQLIKGIQDSMEHSGLIMKAGSSKRGAQVLARLKSEHDVSTKRWESLIRNLNAYSSALASAFEIEISVHGAHSSAFELCDDSKAHLFENAARHPTRQDSSDQRICTEQPENRQDIELVTMQAPFSDLTRRSRKDLSGRLPAQPGHSAQHKSPIDSDDVAIGPDDAIVDLPCPNHPTRSIESCPRECGWQMESSNELADAINVIQHIHAARLSLIAQERPDNSSLSTKQPPRIKPCHILILLGVLTIGSSLGVGLWRSESLNDLSGGFSLAQYILGVGIFIVGSMVALHAKRCTCWQSVQSAI